MGDTTRLIKNPLPPLLRMAAAQLKVPAESWGEDGQRAETRREHLLELQSVFGFQTCTTRHYRPSVYSLGDLAWQIDKGIVLASSLVEGLHRQSLLLPSLKVIERVCAEAVTRANRRQPAHLRGADRCFVGRPPSAPGRTARAQGCQQDDLAGLAASVTCQSQLAPHALTHRTPQSLAGTRPARRH